jgi:hypothetical protein
MSEKITSKKITPIMRDFALGAALAIPSVTPMAVATYVGLHVSMTYPAVLPTVITLVSALTTAYMLHHNTQENAITMASRRPTLNP